MSEQLNKVCVNLQQDFTDAQKAQARANIGALAASASGLQSVVHDSNLSGLGTSGQPLGLSSTVRLEQSTSATVLTPGLVSSTSYLASSWVQPGMVWVSNNYQNSTANLVADELRFSASGSSEKVDMSSIYKWNHQVGFLEDCDPLGGGDYAVDSAHTYYSSHNWVVRDISASGLPAMSMYGFASIPNLTGSYLVTQQGGFTAFDPATKQDVLTPGTLIEIVPGTGNSTVIRNAMHKETFSTYLYYNSLSNTDNNDLYLGPWRLHFHKDAITDWTAASNKLWVEVRYAGGCGNYGSYRLSNYWPYSSQSNETNNSVHFVYNGNDPYVEAGNPHGFPYWMPDQAPTSVEPDFQVAHRWQCDAGTAYGDWIDLSAELRYQNTNVPNSNALYLMLKGTYAYHYE